MPGGLRAIARHLSSDCPLAPGMTPAQTTARRPFGKRRPRPRYPPNRIPLSDLKAGKPMMEACHDLAVYSACTDVVCDGGWRRARVGDAQRLARARARTPSS